VHLIYFRRSLLSFSLYLLTPRSLLFHDSQSQFSSLHQCRITKQTSPYPRRIYRLNRVERGSDWLRSRAHCVSLVSIISNFQNMRRHPITSIIDSLRGFLDGEIGAKSRSPSHHHPPTSKGNGYHHTSSPRLLYHHPHHDLARSATPLRENALQHGIDGHALSPTPFLRLLRSPSSISAV
jgi:hypothetical protein